MTERAQSVFGRRRAVRRRTLIAGAGSALALPAVQARAQAAGVALVIGNSKYKWEASLPNVKRDVADIARAFEALGLKTELMQDVGRDALRSAVDRFGTRARGAPSAVFYFAGHGAYWENFTRLVPNDVDLGNTSGMKDLVTSGQVITAMKDAGQRLAVFDACRNNPADGWRQRDTVATGRMDGSGARPLFPKIPGTLALFSTGVGMVALDGPAGDNSPFAAALLRQLARPPVDLWSLPGSLRRDLLLATDGQQFLWSESTLRQSAVVGAGTSAMAGRPAPAIAANRIVELTNAYNYAAAQPGKLAIPAGLVALRPRTPTPNADKVGAYRFESAGGVPSMFVVMSADGDRTYVLFASSDRGTPYWINFPATFSGGILTLATTSAAAVSLDNSITISWRDAHSGSLTLPKGHAALMGSTLSQARFTRLDG